MKQIVFLFFGVLTSLSVNAQVNIPAASPSATLTQTVGLTSVELDYSRPSMKGRKIFGGILPYDKLWRTGANATTKFTVEKSIYINNQELKAGTYSLFTIPGENSWEVIFYTDDSNPLMTTVDESKVALRVAAQPQQLPVSIETFTLSIDDVAPEGAVLGIMWENIYVGVPFKVGTDQEVMASIDAALNGPSAEEYYNAAVYYLNSDKDIQKAKTWMDKAISMTPTPRFWQLRQQSLILAKSGDKKAAIEAAKKSLADANKAGNEDYIRMNTMSLKEWGGM